MGDSTRPGRRPAGRLYQFSRALCTNGYQANWTNTAVSREGQESNPLREALGPCGVEVPHPHVGTAKTRRARKEVCVFTQCHPERAEVGTTGASRRTSPTVATSPLPPHSPLSRGDPSTHRSPRGSRFAQDDIASVSRGPPTPKSAGIRLRLPGFVLRTTPWQAGYAVTSRPRMPGAGIGLRHGAIWKCDRRATFQLPLLPDRDREPLNSMAI
jgi:hypothetical protein